MSSETQLLRLREDAVKLHQAGHLPAASQAYSNILRLEPSDPFALHQLGIILAAAGNLPAAADHISRALSKDDRSAEANFNLGLIRTRLGQYPAALTCFERAAALDPLSPETHFRRGHTYRLLRQPQSALAALATALKLRPDFPEAACSRAGALLGDHRPLEALAAYEELLLRYPHYAQANYEKGLCLLQVGRFAEGFPLAEWRRRMNSPLGSRSFAAAPWSGTESLRGRRICLHWEQGLGDTIQFCRYALPLREAGAEVVLLVQPRLRSFITRALPQVQVITDERQVGSIDYHAPLMSMPALCGTTAESIPARTPYLTADPARVERWREQVGESGFKVGVCWQGKPGLMDIGRSFPPEALAMLARMPGIRLISLQRPQPPQPAARSLDGVPVEVLSAPLDEEADAFVDTAALMQSLELVITPDTSIAHLAGALGRPCWVALQHVPDWRWMLERADSPWYPTMRLFRQPSPGDWDSVFAAMAAALQRATPP